MFWTTCWDSNLGRSTVERSFTDEMTIDPETGLSALPDGFAWRVDRYSDTLVVTLVIKHERPAPFWSRIFGAKPEVEWDEYWAGGDMGRIYSRVEPQTKDGLIAKTVELYDLVHKHSEKIELIDELVGLYPPKTVL